MSIASRMSEMAGPVKKPMGRAEKDGGDGGGGHTQLHDHGDGTYHSVTSDGERTEHPHIGHALAHIGRHHEPEGHHSHVMHHGGSEDGHTSHHAGMSGGAVSGPHDHANLEALKEHMGNFLDEEENEGGASAAGHGGGEGLFAD